MKRAFLFSGAITAIIVGVFTLAFLTASAATKFSFSGRAIVKVNSTTNKLLTVHFSQLSPLAQDLGLGKVVEVSARSAKIYKPNATGQLERITQGKVAVGDEVSILGNVRTDDSFVASKIVVRNRPFTITGTLSTFDASNRRFTVKVTTSTYRQSAFKDGTVTITYTGDTKFTNRSGQKLEPRDITANNQKVRIEGKVTQTDEFAADAFHENIP